jgi:hypothetical protein
MLAEVKPMLRFPVLLATILLVQGATAQTVVNFDDVTTYCASSGPFFGECLVHDQYLPLGVRFDSTGGGIAVINSTNPVSAPNVAAATMFGSGGGVYASWTDRVYASFWIAGSMPGTVDYVSIALSSSSSMSTLEAFDLAGVSLGSSAGGASSVITVSFPGQIHSVTIHQGPMAFDDFTFDGLLAPSSPFCPGDGTLAACPCNNSGSPGHGCANSTPTGGAILTASGLALLSADTLQLTSSGELPVALSIVLQGTVSAAPVPLGDGLRCVGGIVHNLYIKRSVNGVLVAPEPGDPSISARSAELFDPIAAGSSRYYQVYYRDSDLAFCPAPQGATYNVSSGIAVTWIQ